MPPPPQSTLAFPGKIQGETVLIPPRAPKRERRAPIPRPEILPGTYDETTLALVEIQPHWVHAHWEVSLEDCQRIQDWIAEGGRFIIRVHDVTFIIFRGNNANSQFDVEIGSHDRSWYFDLWSAGRSLVADLGVRMPDGAMRVMARSNCIQTGQTWEEPEGGPRTWLEVDRDPRRRRLVADEGGSGASPGVEPEKVAPEAAMARICREDVIGFYRGLVSE